MWRGMHRRGDAVVRDPAPYTDPIRDAGCKIICQVQTLAQAREAAAAGADIIIAREGTPADIRE